MTLFTATLILALLLIVKGAFLLFNTEDTLLLYKNFLRSKLASYVYFGTASVWFLWIIAHLGPAEFGEYKHLLFVLFAALAIGCFIWVKDFLMVRGWAILLLLLGKLFLDAAFMEEPNSRLFMVVIVYLFIVLGLYFGTIPYKFRDFIEWLYKKHSRAKNLGKVMIGYGLLLTIIAFTY